MDMAFAGNQPPPPPKGLVGILREGMGILSKHTQLAKKGKSG